MEIAAYRVVVRGRVTGVGFRYSALREATRYPGLQGHVRNLDDRAVECVVQGRRPDVDAMVSWLHQGPALAHVTDCQAMPIPVAPDLAPFHVRF